MSRLHQIYFLQRADGLIKIGTTTNFQVRLAALTKAHGFLGVIRIINGDKRRERSLHGQFATFHEYGEWFRPEHGRLRELILALDDGETVTTKRSDLKNEWLAGEAALMAETREKIASMVQARMDREHIKREAALARITTEHGFAKFFLDYISTGRASTVSAYGYRRIGEAYIAELQAALEFFRAEVAKADETDVSDEELLALGESIAALAAKVAVRLTAPSLRDGTDDLDV